MISGLHLSNLSIIPTFERRCRYIERLLTIHPFHEEDQPEAWIQRLIIAPNANANGIATLIIAMFGGGDVVCNELSILYEFEITIIQSIKLFKQELDHIKCNTKEIHHVIDDTLQILESIQMIIDAFDS